MNTWLNDVYNFEQLLFFKLCDFFYVFFLIVLVQSNWCMHCVVSLPNYKSFFISFKVN